MKSGAVKKTFVVVLLVAVVVFVVGLIRAASKKFEDGQSSMFI